MIDDTLRWQLQRLSHSRAYRRKLLAVDRFHVSSLEPPVINLSAMLGAILLIEMHQRPGVIRAVEWVISSLVPKSIRKPVTRGPLQIADGPWNLEAAIRAAYDILQPAVAVTLSRDTAIYSVAAAWNGKAVRQPCSMYGYGEVLRDAYIIATEALTDLVGDRRITR